MDKGTFSIIVVPHDLKKTRTLRVPYALFYAIVGVLAAGVVVMTVFAATYGALLIKAQEGRMYKHQLEELQKRQEQIVELRRNVSRLRAMNLQVRRMLGLVVMPGDSAAARQAERGETAMPEALGASRPRCSAPFRRSGPSAVSSRRDSAWRKGSRKRFFTAA